MSDTAMLRLPRWEEVVESLTDLDGRAIQRRLTQVFVEDEAASFRTREAITAYLVTQLGPWYGVGPWQVGNAVFDLAWESSSFPYRLRNWYHYRFGLGPDIMEGVEPLVTLLTRLLALLDTLPFAPSERRARETLGVTFAAIVDALLDASRARGPWFVYVASCALWLCDAAAIERDGVRWVLPSLTVSCVPDVAPSLIERRMMVQTPLDAIAPAEAAPPLPLEDRIERIGRPLRPSLDEAREAVAGQRPEAAWESLVSRDLLPADFLDSERRSFLRAESGGRTLTPTAMPDRDLLALFASDARGIHHAERLALELVERLLPYGLERRITHLAWTRGPLPSPSKPSLFAGDHDLLRRLCEASAVLSGATLDDEAWLDLLPSAAKTFAPGADLEALRVQCLDAEADLLRALRPMKEDAPSAYDDLFPRWKAALRWQLVTEAGARIPSEGVAQQLGLSTKVQRMLCLAGEPGTAFALIPDALGVLIDLWSTGYSLHEIDGKRGRVVLLVPPVRWGSP